MSLISLSPHAAGSFRPGAFDRPAVDRLSRAVFTALCLLAKAAEVAAQYWRDRQKVHWLANADDAILRDLGIARSDIPRLVRNGRH